MAGQLFESNYLLAETSTVLTIDFQHHKALIGHEPQNSHCSKRVLKIETRARSSGFKVGTAGAITGYSTATGYIYVVDEEQAARLQR